MHVICKQKLIILRLSKC